MASSFAVTVNMTNNPTNFTHWVFDYYYMSDTETGITASRYEHHAPQTDEMCQNLPYNGSHDCTVVFATDGWSYLSFPTEDYCCKCENTFGAVKADWMTTNSTYAGLSTVNGVECQQWTKQGQFLNHLFSANDANQTTVRFYETVRGRLKQWDFLLDTYTPTFDRNLLAAPDGCTTLCNNWCADYRHT